MIRGYPRTPPAARKKTNPSRASRAGRAGARLFLAALALALALVLPPLAGAAAQRDSVRVEGLAALVGGLEPTPGVDVILLSDVELYALIELSGDASGPLPDKPLPQPLMRKALQKLVGEHVIAREAERVRVSEPRASDVARERRRLELRAGGRDRLRALLQRLSVGKRELERILLRRALVTAFLRANLEAPLASARSRPYPIPPAAPERKAAQLPPEQKAGQLPPDRETGQLPPDREAEQSPPEHPGESAATRSRESTLDKAAEHWIRLLMVRTPVRTFGEYTP